MKNSNKVEDDYLKEYTELVSDYINFENECHEYFSQFFSTWINGKPIKIATKGDTQAEFEKRQKMRKELEKKRKKVMEAQEKYLIFCKGKN